MIPYITAISEAGYSLAKCIISNNEILSAANEW